MAFCDAKHVVDLETRCPCERVQPNNRRADGTAPADVEGGSLPSMTCVSASSNASRRVSTP
jgi:hypothetical protein